MRVLYFHQHFTTPAGGGGLRSYQFARALIDRGHSVTMVCGSLSQADTGLAGPFRRGVRRGMVDGIDVIEFELAYSNDDRFLKRSWTFARFAVRSLFVALRESCDVVFATTTPLTAAIPGMAARWLRRKPFVFEVRDLWPELPREMGVITNRAVLAALGALEWMAYRSATSLIALSPGIERGINRIVKDDSKTTMIPNGCDIALFSSPEPSWRPEGVSTSDLMAVFTGAHGIANGLDAVLDVARVLRERHRDDIKIVLVGDGSQKSSLQARAQAEQLTNIVFVPNVTKAKIIGLMAEADVGLQVLANVPAFYDGTSPNKFFDYLASGLPVLINYPGWLADLVEGSGCGYVVPAEEPNMMATVLEGASQNRFDLEEMGVRSRALGESVFDREQLSAQFETVLRSAANHGSVDDR